MERPLQHLECREHRFVAHRPARQAASRVPRRKRNPPSLYSELDSVGDLGMPRCSSMINGHARVVPPTDAAVEVPRCPFAPVPVSKSSDRADREGEQSGRYDGDMGTRPPRWAVERRGLRRLVPAGWAPGALVCSTGHRLCAAVPARPVGPAGRRGTSTAASTAASWSSSVAEAVPSPWPGRVSGKGRWPSAVSSGTTSSLADPSNHRPAMSKMSTDVLPEKSRIWLPARYREALTTGSGHPNPANVPGHSTSCTDP